MGLGSAAIIGLADARDFAAQCRGLVAKGVDPLEERARKQKQALLEAASAVTFETCAANLIEAKRPSWRNQKHAAQWERSLRTYAFPSIGRLPVGSVDTAMVLNVLQPIWQTKHKTANRLRERLEAILDAAKARGFRQGENPARWRGHLENLLAKPTTARLVKHHAALPYFEISEFMVNLRKSHQLAARALELLILTATRTNEVLSSEWDEFDLDNSIWVIPAHRTKTGKVHKVPLSAPALALLRKLGEQQDSGYVFPGQRHGKPLCHMAQSKQLHRMGRRDITVHGFRTTFRDWAAEQTNFSREVAEMALGHSIGSAVEAAYRRGTLFDKRARLMSAWATFCATPRPSVVVVPIRASQT
jgi:integrase